VLLVVYASLYPFEGWRVVGVSPFAYLSAAWPRYVTWFDLLLNVAGYLPFGLLAIAALRPNLRGFPAFVVAGAGAALLSLLLEAAQTYLPARFASNLDLLCNVIGAALGAAIGDITGFFFGALLGGIAGWAIGSKRVSRLEALEKRVAALEAALAEPPDVALLDIGMPGLNGYDLARRLRAEPETRDVVLVAITGWGQESDRRRAREAGFTRHLVKPVDPLRLRDAIAA